MKEADKAPDANDMMIHIPAPDHESCSSMKDFYAEWKDLSCLPTQTTEQAFLAIKRLATSSRAKYLNAPVAFPDGLRSALSRVMKSPADRTRPKELELRRKTLRQLKFHLLNQANKATKISDRAAAKWNSALTALRTSVARRGLGKMFLTVYNDDEVSRILDLADAASSDIWDLVQMKMITNPSSDIRKDANSIEAQFAKHPDWSNAQRDAYIASRNCDEITLSARAKSLGIRACDQKESTIKVKGGRTYTIPKTSYIPWMIIRLLVSSPSCEATLFKKWDTSWGKDESKLAFKKEWICPLSTVKRFNGLKFCLKNKKNISA